MLQTVWAHWQVSEGPGGQGRVKGDGCAVKLHFILADTYRTYLATAFDNEHVPYRKRIVTIELTPEQMEAIKPRKVGVDQGKDVYEEVLDVILEG